MYRNSTAAIIKKMMEPIMAPFLSLTKLLVIIPTTYDPRLARIAKVKAFQSLGLIKK